MATITKETLRKQIADGTLVHEAAQKALEGWADGKVTYASVKTDAETFNLQLWGNFSKTGRQLQGEILKEACAYLSSPEHDDILEYLFKCVQEKYAAKKA